MMGNLQDTAIEEILHRHFVGRIGCHARHTTYVVPVSYAYDGTYIYAHSHEGLKLQLMRLNPEVCFEVDNMDDMANWQSVICWGHFEELWEEKDRNTAASILLNRALPIVTSSTVKLTPHWPFGTAESKQLKGVLFRIQLQKKTGRFERGDNNYFYAT